MDLKAIRKSFVEKVSWGPAKITFGEAIAAFDHTMAEHGLGETVAPASYSPAQDAIGVPVNQIPRVARRAKAPQEDSMELDTEQENAEALANLARGNS